MKDFYELKDRPSYQKKTLTFENIKSWVPPVGIYSLECSNKETNELDFYTQIDYIPNDNGGEITAIDFDGGPKLSIGTVVEDGRIVGFEHDGNFDNIKVLMEPI